MNINIPRDIVERSATAWRLIQAQGLLSFARSPLASMAALDFSIMAELSRLGKTTVATLLEVTGAKRSTMSSALSRLEKKRFILRSIARDDYRSWNIALSSEGLEKLILHKQEEIRVWSHILSRLEQGSDMVTFARVLETLAK